MLPHCELFSGLQDEVSHLMQALKPHCHPDWIGINMSRTRAVICTKQKINFLQQLVANTKYLWFKYFFNFGALPNFLHYITRKPCYHKDDCVMHPIYGCPENFQESLATPMATIPKIVNVLLLQSIVLKCLQNLKFVALPIPEIIGGTPKNWAVPRYAHTPFLQNF